MLSCAVLSCAVLSCAVLFLMPSCRHCSTLSVDFPLVAACKRLRLLGVDVAPAVPWEITGFSLPHGPHVVLHPNLGATIKTLAPKFPTPAEVHVHPGATLILEGAGIVVHHLDVKGTLIVEAVDGAHVGALRACLWFVGWDGRNCECG